MINVHTYNAHTEQDIKIKQTFWRNTWLHNIADMSFNQQFSIDHMYIFDLYSTIIGDDVAVIVW